MDRVRIDRRGFLWVSCSGVSGWLLVPVLTPDEAPTVEAAWRTAVCSAYGPGLYGRRTACGQILRTDTIGVAHRTYRCGTRLKFVGRNGQVVRANVIDRGPFVAGRTFDLTEGLVRRMAYASARAFGVRSVRWDFA
jgi:rare lipoprotein A